MAKSKRPAGSDNKDEKVKAKEKAEAAKKSASRNLVETIVILIVMVVVIRWFLLESFRIPSSSMEPALIGNPYYGDRVLAWKPSTRFSTPDRWSINVFVKHPDRNERAGGERSDRNFIKRALGLPGDRFVISGGDIFVESGESPEGRIARKPDHVQRTVWHCVYESADSWLPNWKLSDGLAQDEATGRIVATGDAEASASFAQNHYEGDGGQVTNLYVRSTRTTVRCPKCHELGKVNIGTSNTRVTCPAAGCGHVFSILEEDVFSDVERCFVCASCSRSLTGTIVDFPGKACSVCKRPIPRTIDATFGVPGRYPRQRGLEVPVGDMRVSCTVVPAGAAGVVSMKMTVDARAYVARMDLGARTVSLTGPDGVKATHAADASVQSTPFRFSLAHVDHALEVALDGAVVMREEYERGWRSCAGSPRTNAIVMTAKGDGLALASPKVERDLHYLPKGHPRWFEFYDAGRRRPGFALEPIRKMLDDSRGVGEGDAVRTRKALAKDEFLMIGDNSPSSYDGRMWGPIKKSDLVGEAVILFWPPNRAGMAN